MRKVLICVLLLALLCGCGRQMVPTGESQFDFYYRKLGAQEDEVFSSPTGALASERVTLGGDVGVNEILLRYFLGPSDESLGSIFPEGSACTKSTLQNGVLTLELNEACASLTGLQRTLAAACLTLTLTQLDTVQTVRIETPSGALPGQNSARWSADSFLLQDTSWLYPERVVQLFFVGQNGKLQAEKRAISYQNPELLPENTLLALIDGPDSAYLYDSVPSGTQVLDVSVSGSMCTVVLSEEFSACDTDVTRATLAVHSVAATLCGLNEIDQVQLQLEDGSDLSYCSIAQPLMPDASWYD